eukprot:7339688-Prymnesium_polylepis.2
MLSRIAASQSATCERGGQFQSLRQQRIGRALPCNPEIEGSRASRAHKTTMPHATWRISLCSSEPSQRTERSCPRNEWRSTSSYANGTQYQERKMTALTEGVTQKAKTIDTGSHSNAPLAALAYNDCLFFLPLPSGSLAKGDMRIESVAPTSGIASTQTNGAIERSSKFSFIPAPTTHALGTTQFVQSTSPMKPVRIRGSQQAKEVAGRGRVAVSSNERCTLKISGGNHLGKGDCQLELRPDADLLAPLLGVVGRVAQPHGALLKSAMVALLVNEVYPKRKHGDRDANAHSSTHAARRIWARLAHGAVAVIVKVVALAYFTQGALVAVCASVITREPPGACGGAGGCIVCLQQVATAVTRVQARGVDRQPVVPRGHMERLDGRVLRTDGTDWAR